MTLPDDNTNVRGFLSWYIEALLANDEADLVELRGIAQRNPALKVGIAVVDCVFAGTTDPAERGRAVERIRMALSLPLDTSGMRHRAPRDDATGYVEPSSKPKRSETRSAQRATPTLSGIDQAQLSLLVQLVREGPLMLDPGDYHRTQVYELERLGYISAMGMFGNRQYAVSITALGQQAMDMTADDSFNPLVVSDAEWHWLRNLGLEMLSAGEFTYRAVDNPSRRRYLDATLSKDDCWLLHFADPKQAERCYELVLFYGPQAGKPAPLVDVKQAVLLDMLVRSGADVVTAGEWRSFDGDSLQQIGYIEVYDTDDHRFCGATDTGRAALSAYQRTLSAASD